MNEQTCYTVTGISPFAERDAIAGTEVVGVIALNQVFDWIRVDSVYSHHSWALHNCRRPEASTG